VSIKDCDRKARANYRKKVQQVKLELFPSEEDIKAQLAARLEAGEPKASYIKRLIREDIARKESEE
jgi:hypothetical protein